MKNSKISTIVFTLVSFLILFLLLIMHYRYPLGDNNNDRQFYENIIIGIFSSSVLLSISSLVNYFVETSRIRYQILVNYIDFMKTYKTIIENNYFVSTDTLDKVRIYWNVSCNLYRENKPFIKTIKDKNAKETHNIIREILMVIIGMENESYNDKDVQSLKALEKRAKTLNKEQDMEYLL